MIHAQNLPSKRWGLKADATVTHNDGYMYASEPLPVDVDNLLEGGGTRPLPEEIQGCVRAAITGSSFKRTSQPDMEMEFDVDED